MDSVNVHNLRQVVALKIDCKIPACVLKIKVYTQALSFLVDILCNRILAREQRQSKIYSENNLKFIIKLYEEG